MTVVQASSAQRLNNSQLSNKLAANMLAASESKQNKFENTSKPNKLMNK